MLATIKKWMTYVGLGFMAVLLFLVQSLRIRNTKLEAQQAEEKFKAENAARRDAEQRSAAQLEAIGKAQADRDFAQADKQAGNRKYFERGM